MQSGPMRDLYILDRKLEFFVAQLAQVRLERQMASLGFNSAPIKCDSSYVENMYVAAIVDAQRARADLVDQYVRKSVDDNCVSQPS